MRGGDFFFPVCDDLDYDLNMGCSPHDEITMHH